MLSPISKSIFVSKSSEKMGFYNPEKNSHGIYEDYIIVDFGDCYRNGIFKIGRGRDGDSVVMIFDDAKNGGFFGTIWQSRYNDFIVRHSESLSEITNMLEPWALRFDFFEKVNQYHSSSILSGVFNTSTPSGLMDYKLYMSSLLDKICLSQNMEKRDSFWIYPEP